MAIRTFGPNAVDWEQRVDLDRLRVERLQRLKDELERSELGALLTFDFSNIRYMTSTHIGTWAMNKLIRFALLPRGGEPVVWDFGSAARHHQLFNPWLDGDKRARAGISTLRGAFNPAAGIAEDVADKIATELAEHNLTNEPIGVDIVEMPVLAAMRDRGLDSSTAWASSTRRRAPSPSDRATTGCSRSACHTSGATSAANRCGGPRCRAPCRVPATATTPSSCRRCRPPTRNRSTYAISFSVTDGVTRGLLCGRRDRGS